MLMSGCAEEHRNKRSCSSMGRSSTVPQSAITTLPTSHPTTSNGLKSYEESEHALGVGCDGGVINITTKRGRDKPNVSAFAEYGSFNTIREGASLSGKKGPIDFSGSITRLDTAGFSAINYRRGATERDGYHNWQGSVRLGADLPKDGRLEFS